jgi:hypothetical protein
MNHAHKFSIIDAGQKGTEDEPVSLLDRLRDALGSYTAHSRLELTKVGRLILDKTATLHLAMRSAYRRLDATEWSERTGFRSPGDYRKALCAEHPYNLTDVAALRIVDLDGYREFVDALARDAGGRFELITGEGRPIAQTIARLGTCTAELNSAFLLALSPEGDGGSTITRAEAEDFRGHLVTLQRQVAEVEAALAAMEGKRK